MWISRQTISQERWVSLSNEHKRACSTEERDIEENNVPYCSCVSCARGSLDVRRTHLLISPCSAFDPSDFTDDISPFLMSITYVEIIVPTNEHYVRRDHRAYQ